MPLTLVTCLAENTYPLSRAIAHYLSSLGISVLFDEQLTYQKRIEGLCSGEIDLGFMCGLLYASLKDKHATKVTPLVAPVSLALSDKLASYYSYVIVKAPSPYKTFADLEGSLFCINESDSFSGYHIMHYHLATLGKPKGFFSTMIQSGSHMGSIQQVLQGKADSAVIDHTLFDYWVKNNPDAADRLRVIERLGPFPMPPLLISERVPEELKHAIQKALLEMPGDVLNDLDMLEFQTVNDRTYDPIREAARLGTDVKLAS
jgi:phosphonate transport system substrate-binding protein